MAEDKTVSSMTDAPKGKSLMLVLAGLSVVIVVVLALYLGLQKSTLNEEQERLKGEIASLDNEIASLESQKVEAAQLAQKWLDVIEEEEIRWSLVLSQIQSLIPYDASSRNDKIQFLSYSGSEGGHLSLNAQTRELRTEPFDDVAELIEVFNDSSFFFDSYVPSITRGETNEGKRVGSFIFITTYKDVGLADLEMTDESAEDQPKVSRQ